jgi:hypothetical protein
MLGFCPERTMAQDYSLTITTLAAGPLLPRDELREQVQGHIEAAKAACDASTFFDGELAARLGKACLELLDIEGLDDAESRLVMAACIYFVDDEDSDGDFRAILGFEDDAEVYNQVVAKLGRPELKVDY